MHSLKTHCVVVLLMLLVAITGAYPASAKEKPDSGKLLTGKVVDHDDHPLADSVVYLSNTRTRAVKTYIVGPDGMYHFPALSPNTDYEVYAQFNGRKSDTKTLSQFDDRATVTIVLRIDTK
jgi:hypothetical protein